MEQLLEPEGAGPVRVRVDTEEQLADLQKVLSDRVFVIPILLPDFTHVDLFVDGSCFHPEDLPYSMAGVAVVHSPRIFTVVTVFSELLPGQLQTIYRAEVWAGTWAIARHRCITVHSDNSSFVKEAKKRLLRRTLGLPPLHHNHSDLWNLFEQIIATRDCSLIQVSKVKAHDSWQTAEDAHSAWRAWANDRADESAKAAVKDSPLWPRMVNIFNSQKSISKSIQRYANFICQSARVHLDRPRENPTAGPQSQQLLSDFAGLPLPNTIVYDDEQLLACTHNPIFAHCICQWASQLVWIQLPEPQDISWVELYTDFCLFTRSRAPVNVDPQRKLRNQNQFCCYAMRERSMDADVAISEMGTETRVFHSAIKMFLKSGVILWPASPKNSVASIGKFGFSVKSQGLDMRPLMFDESASLAFLSKHIMFDGKSDARRTRRNLKFPSPFSRCPIQVPESFNITNAQIFSNYRNLAAHAGA